MLAIDPRTLEDVLKRSPEVASYRRAPPLCVISLTPDYSFTNLSPFFIQVTPHSAQAQVHIPIGQAGPQHPYPSGGGGVGLGYEYARQGEYKTLEQPQPYTRQSPMIPTTNPLPPAITPVRAQGGVGQDYDQAMADDKPKPSLLRILTCRC